MFIRLAASRAFAVSALAATLPVTARAADSAAQDVVKKMEAVYAGAKSFDGVVTINQVGTPLAGKPSSNTIVQKIKFRAPNMFQVQMSATATGANAAKAASFGRTISSDGKTLYDYSPSLKQYRKSPAPPTVSLMQLFRQLMPNPNAPGLTLTPASATGHAVYTVQIKPMAPATFPPTITAEQKARYLEQIKAAKPVQYTIDKQNYHLLKIYQPGTRSNITFDFSQQNVNAAVAPTAFAFTPPAGSKEFTPPPGMGAPGAPGGMTPAPRPR